MGTMKGRFAAQTVTDQALTASYTSPPTSLKRMDRCAVRISITGSPTGALALEGSVDDGENFTDLQLNLAAIAGSPEEYLIDMAQTALTDVRVVYTHTSGSGFMDLWITGKASG